jgi:hypothetical protein
MLREETWSDHLLATPADIFWKAEGAPAKGAFGGECHRASCRHGGADWYNKSSGKYYCDECARAFNEICLSQGAPKLCELHF